MRRARLIHCLPALVVGLLLAGCGGLLGPRQPPIELYNLTAAGAPPTLDLAPVSWQLVVEEPLAAGGLADHRIAVRPEPTRLQYVAGVRWTSSPPAMLQGIMIESLEASGRIAAVGRPLLGLRSDYRLATELRAFEAEYFNSASSPRVRVRMAARLLRGRELEAAAGFEAREDSAADNLTAIVAAFDRASHRLVDELVRWVLVAGAAAEPSVDPLLSPPE